MKFENCIYDHLQLADRFLKAATQLVRVQRIASNYGFDDLKCVNYKFNHTSLFFGFTVQAGAFPMDCGLCIWARENREIWGYEYGDYMFAILNGESYGKYKESDVKIADLAAHYIGVAERLMKLEDE